MQGKHAFGSSCRDLRLWPLLCSIGTDSRMSVLQSSEGGSICVVTLDVGGTGDGNMAVYPVAFDDGLTVLPMPMLDEQTGWLYCGFAAKAVSEDGKSFLEITQYISGKNAASEGVGYLISRISWEDGIYQALDQKVLSAG